MWENKIVEHSFSAWTSPVVLVFKKDGTFSFYVDYRKPNVFKEFHAYPLPSISELAESLADTTVFSTLDLSSGRW